MVQELNSYVTGHGEMKAPVDAEPARAVKTTKPKAEKPAGKVVKFTPAPKKPAASQAAEMIPFDDEPRAKVGTTEGF
ncbi:hypothetical protein D3C72_1864200 [compost metagenome]